MMSFRPAAVVCARRSTALLTTSAVADRRYIPRLERETAIPEEMAVSCLAIELMVNRIDYRPALFAPVTAATRPSLNN
jgi:hypothetical protein